MEEVESFTLWEKPVFIEDGAVFKFSKKMKPAIAKMGIEYKSWNDEVLGEGVEVPPTATVIQVFKELQKRVGEKFDDPSLFNIVHEGGPVRAPWQTGSVQPWKLLRSVLVPPIHCAISLSLCLSSPIPPVWGIHTL
jgi:hypothetical protein